MEADTDGSNRPPDAEYRVEIMTWDGEKRGRKGCMWGFYL